MGRVFAPIWVGVALTLSTPAMAALVTSLPSGTLLPFAPINKHGGNTPVTVAPGVTWTSSEQTTGLFFDALYGWTQGYNFDGNGIWQGLPAMVGLNTYSGISGRIDFMTFAFDNPVQGVGGIVNWSTARQTNFLPWGASISTYDASGNLLDTLVLSDSGTNLLPPDAFYGFVEDRPVISRFVLTDGFIGLRDLAVAESVPEPSSRFLLGWGLTAIAWFALRRRPWSGRLTGLSPASGSVGAPFVL